MNDYYSRQIMLWGEDKQKNLKSKNILLVGSGGLGCSVALALSGTGIGRIDIVDFDKVELHNIHRQVLFSIDDVGEFKAKVAVDKIIKRNLDLRADAYILEFNEFIKNNKKSYDLIIDATDNLFAREQIDRYAKESSIPWIYGSVEEFNGQVCFFNKANFNIFASKKVEPKGISAPMVMQIASFEANLALRYLLNLPINSDVLHYLYYNNKGEFEIKKFNLGV